MCGACARSASGTLMETADSLIATLALHFSLCAAALDPRRLPVAFDVASGTSLAGSGRLRV